MSAAAPAAPGPRNIQLGRLSTPKLFMLAAIGMSAVLIVAYVAVLTTRKAPQHSTCGAVVCPPPPRAPVVTKQLYQNAALGYQFVYDGDVWSIASSDANGVTLQAVDPDGSVWGLLIVEGAPTADKDPQTMLNDRLSKLSDQIVGLTPDSDPKDAIPTPTVGDIHGVGGPYLGTIDSPQGTGQQEAVISLAASDGQSTVGFTLVSSPDPNDLPFAAQATDQAMNTLLFPSEKNG